MDTISDQFIILPTDVSVQKCNTVDVEKATSDPNQVLNHLFLQLVSTFSFDAPSRQQVDQLPVQQVQDESCAGDEHDSESTDEFKIIIPKTLLNYNAVGYVSEDEDEVEELNKKAAECLKRYRKYIEFKPLDVKTDLSNGKDEVDGAHNNYGDKRIRSQSKMRKDVMFKTLLRSIRRFYIRKFRTENPRFYLKNKIPYKNDVYETAVRKFVEKFFVGYNNQDDLFFYIIAMIRQEWYIGIGDIPAHIQSSIGQIYSCFYKFKLWQFEQLAKTDHIQYMFDKMLEEGAENLIRMERSMMVRKDVYLSLFDDFKAFAAE